MADKPMQIIIDEDVWAQAKAAAALNKITLQEWIDQAFREKLGLVPANKD